MKVGLGIDEFHNELTEEQRQSVIAWCEREGLMDRAPEKVGPRLPDWGWGIRGLVVDREGSVLADVLVRQSSESRTVRFDVSSPPPFIAWAVEEAIGAKL